LTSRGFLTYGRSSDAPTQSKRPLSRVLPSPSPAIRSRVAREASGRSPALRKPVSKAQLRKIAQLASQLEMGEPPVVETRYGALATIRELMRRLETRERQAAQKQKQVHR
jgi:hypothetical protein